MSRAEDRPAGDRPPVRRPPPDGVGEAPGLPGGEWQRPSAQLRRVRHTQLAVAGVPALGVAIGVAELNRGTVAAICGALGVIVAWALADRYCMRRVAAWRFAERHDDLLVGRGVMIRRLSVIPYGRMQFVDVTAGPIERAFGVATVRMHTAAAASDARIPGLASVDAGRLRDQLTVLGESQAAGL